MKADTVQTWTLVTKNIGENTNILQLAQSPKLNFSHSQAVAPLIEYDPEQVEEMLDKAIAGEQKEEGKPPKVYPATVVKRWVKKALKDFITPE